MKKAILAILAAVLLISGCADTKEQVSETPNTKIVFAVFRDNTDAFRTAASGFSAENPDIDIKITELSDDSSENHRILSSVLIGNEVMFDVIVTEDIWMKEFIEAGYLKPLDKYISVDMSQYPAHFADIALNNGILYGIPVELDAGIMYYRRDLTAGSADFRMLSESSDIDYSIQGADKEEMICTVRECVNLCGDIQSGLELYKKLVLNSFSSANTYLSDFKNGRTAYARSWISNDSFIKNGFGKISGKVKTSMLDSENGTYATARAYCAAVNSASAPEKDDALKAFLRYLVREDVQLQTAKGRGTLPLKYKYFDIPAVCDYNEYNMYFADKLDSLDFRPLDSCYMQYSDAAQKAVKEYIDEKISLDSAAEAFEKIY